MRLLTPLLLFLPLVGHAAPTPDPMFLLARDAWRASSISQLESALPGVAGTVLEPYAQYWRLQLRIEEATPDEIDAFLRRNEGTVLAEQLRKDWLRVLGKRQQWEFYDRVYTEVRATEPDLACYSYLSRAQRNDPTAMTGAMDAWDALREIPDGCRPLIDAQVATGKIDTDQVWLRIRGLNRAGQPAEVRRTLAYLVEAQRPTDKQLDSIEKNPDVFLRRVDRVDLRQRMNRELTIYALQRLARSDPEAAEQRWSAVRGKFGDFDEAYVWGELAFQAARKHLPQALSWFARADAAPLTDIQLEWRARAALRERDWAELNNAIERMPEALRQQPTWVYWRGRALYALGNVEPAEALYRQIAGAPHFYGKLAQEELGLPLVLPTRRHEATAPELAAAAANPGLQRAVALFSADMWLEAVREWNWSIRDMDDRQLLAVAEYARREQLWDRAINTAERTTALHDYWLRFLAPYREQFAAQAQARGLEEHWVLGLVRQESRFVSNARSSAGAAGLMQVMPATARWIAKKLDIGYRSDQIADVDTNIALGTGYLRYVLDSLDGSPVLAAAAYNAGPGRARRWKADFPLEGAIYVETIPFGETRDYVKKVMTNTSFYAALYGGERQSLKQRLGVIPSRTPDEGYAPTITGQATLQ